MLETYSSDVGSMGSCSVPVAVKVLDWREEAVGACREAELQDTDRLGQDIAHRLLGLTGQTVGSRSTYIDREARMATAVVGGVVFRLRRGELFLVRPCVYYGVRSFESSPVHDVVDLGRALSVWEPRCTGCEPEDEDWTHSF